MGGLTFACLVPHPPIMVPEVGGREVLKVESTVRAMEEVGKELKASAPEAVFFITPHSLAFQDALGINVVSALTGNLGAFGAPQVSFRYPNDLTLAEALGEKARQRGVPVVTLGAEILRRYHLPGGLDHGIMAPLYYLRKQGLEAPLIPISIGFLPPTKLYLFGICLQEVIEAGPKQVAVVASGDLSHRLLPGAPAGYAPEGKVFDLKIKEALAKMDVEEILNLPEDLIEKAGECGLKPLTILLGVLDGYQVEAKVLSYEGPFGVGYLVARFLLQGQDPTRRLRARILGEDAGKAHQARSKESPLVQLARASLESYVREGKVLSLSSPLAPEMEARKGVFVSLKKHGKLRGCIGTILPTQANVAAEVICNAISAGTQDPRFNPVRPEELEELVYTVDVLGEPEPVEDVAELDPQRYGVIVRAGERVGLLLPALEGINTVKEQLLIAKQKAGIAPEEPVEIFRFQVERYY